MKCNCSSPVKGITEYDANLPESGRGEPFARGQEFFHVRKVRGHVPRGAFITRVTAEELLVPLSHLPIRQPVHFIGMLREGGEARRKQYVGLHPYFVQLRIAEFADSPLGQKYPSAVAVWENAWDRFIPFLAFPPAVRRVIYTTNAIESLNYQLRKVTKNRSQFPTDDSVVKLLWLAICNIEDKRAREREKERGKPGPRKACGRLVQGQVTNWKQALAQLTAAYPDRIPHYP